MKINPLINRIFFKGEINQVPPSAKILYREGLKYDTFKRSTPPFGVRKTKVKDNNGNVVNVFIREREENDGFKYVMHNEDGREIGQIWLTELNKDSLYIPTLRADYANYRGVGTELIKSAIQKSREMGYGGQLSLCAANFSGRVALFRQSSSPVPFYYKLGFKCRDKKEQVLVELGMADLKETGRYTGPREASMFLDKNAAERLLNK